MDRLLAATARAEASHFWFRGFRSFVGPLVARAVQGVQAPMLLDCGCGTGHNVAWLAGFGRAAGFDLNWSGLVAGRRAGRRGLARGSVVAAPFQSSRFDVVTSFDVLYMLDEETERRALDEMRRVLRPGGALIVNVAAMPVLHGDHSRLSTERRRYTRPVLRDRLEGAGFEIDTLTHTNAALFPLMLATRAGQRLKGTRAEESDIQMPPRVINEALTAVLRAEAALVQHVTLPVGSSLLALARKR